VEPLTNRQLLPVESFVYSAVFHDVFSIGHIPLLGAECLLHPFILKGSRLAQTCEKLGAGEILLNCFDKDSTNSGFDIELVNHTRENVSIPVIASSGAGKVEHFSEVFEKTDVEAVLAPGIFHREEVPIESVKEHLRERGIETR
jgi:imidazole glycerol phosphate synthase subunit HisF